jgi:hypothetical protein
MTSGGSTIFNGSGAAGEAITDDGASKAALKARAQVWSAELGPPVSG